MLKSYSFGGYDPFSVIKLNKWAYIDRWSNDYEGTPKSSWDQIFDAVESEFEAYADDEASSDETGRTLVNRFEDGDIDDDGMDSEFDMWVEWLDLNDYDFDD